MAFPQPGEAVDIFGNAAVKIAHATSGRLENQTGPITFVAVLPASDVDGSYEISGNVLVTSSIAHKFSVVCLYTDESNTARSLTCPLFGLNGSLIAQGSIGQSGGTIPYSLAEFVLRAKASTTITLSTVGIFTSVTYNAEGHIRQIV